MLINLRNAVLALVAGSMFATSAQAGRFGGLPHLGGNGGGLATGAKGMSNFKNSGSSNFGSLQKMGQRSSSSGLLNNSFKNQGQANFAKGFGQNNNVLNQVKNSQSTSHNPFQNNMSNKLSSANASQGGSQSLFGKLNQKNGATNPTGAMNNNAANATGNSHQSFMDKLNHKNNSQNPTNTAKIGNTTTPNGTNATTATNATQTATNGNRKNAHDLIDTSAIDTTATNLQNQVNTGIQQTQTQAGGAATGTGIPAGGGATNVGVGGGANANPGNIGATTGNGGANTGTGGTGGMGGGTNGGTGGMAGNGMGNGMGNGTGGGFSNGGTTNFNSFGGGGFLPTVIGAALASGGGFGGGYGGGYGGYAAPDYVESAPQYVEAPAPQYVQSPAPQYLQTAANQSAPASIIPVSTTAAAVGSPLITSVEPLPGADSQVLVRGSGFGTAGNLALDVNGVQLVLELSAWTPNVIIAKVPTLNIANNAAIHFTVARTDGASSQPFDPSAPAVVAAR